jgi:DNA (cytosine-5)-methyltransferase 1
MHSFYEFFAGGGMARAGLGDTWTCLFANDFDVKKCSTYKANWGASELKIGDIAKLETKDLPSYGNAVWASFPCQDLSLAGGGAGLKGERSGTFWPFWRLMKSLIKEERAPSVIVLENVCGTLNSHDGKDFSAICDTFEQAGYRYGAVVIDAALFVPHSRPRLFIIGIHDRVAIPENLQSEEPISPFHTRSLQNGHRKLSPRLKKSWIWWRLQKPTPTLTRFSDLIEDEPVGVSWYSDGETKQLLEQMSDVNLDKIKAAKRSGEKIVGTIYKRTRVDSNGIKVQRAEVRFDDIAGCLRTPAGGSSRQLIIVVMGNKVRSRLISTRETARLMGLPETYKLPSNYNEAYHLTGDGVVVPVVRYLAGQILEPLLDAVKTVKNVA